jgi:uncharacterized repeat protein (TIGR01451 family)
VSISANPNLVIQTASLWASGDSSIFSGTGGPQGYDPFFGMFADVVNSAGLDAEPFADQLWNVEAGDEVVFVVAVQNKAAVAAYDLRLRDTMPAGFIVPPEGTGLTVTDGAGNLLDVAGDLFGDGLQLLDPVAASDLASGADIVLLTFALQAAANLAVPAATLQNSAQILSFAATPGGPDLSGQAGAASLSAASPVTTSGIIVTSTPGQNLVTLQSGRQASFDITASVPAGEVRDLRIDELFPHAGGAWLQFVSAQVVQKGPDLTFSGPATVQADGSIAFGTVDNAAGGQGTNYESIVLRVTVQGAGTAAGQGVLDTKVSAADPNSPGARWTQDVTNTLPLEAPNVAPTISGASGGQNATNTMSVQPFAAVTLTDPDPGQTETLRIHLSDPLFGNLSGLAGLTRSGSDYVLTGAIDQVQAGLRSLVFTTGPGRSGTETFTLTLDDGAGGTAADSTTGVSVAPSAPAGAAIQHFPLSSTGTVLTSTAGGSRTVAQVETYQGPVDYLQSQFIYDGSAAMAIVAQSPNMFIKNVAGSAAVQLQSGQNVVDAGSGSNFLLGAPALTSSFSTAASSIPLGTPSSAFTPATSPRSGATRTASPSTIGTTAQASPASPA